jgi:hypothetical protein
MVEVLLIGEPKLRKVSENVSSVNDDQFLKEKKLLHEALEEFRSKNGFGRWD